MTRYLLPLFLVASVAAADDPKLVYKKGKTREETARLSLAATGLPTLGGSWKYIGPFDNSDMRGFDTVYPPETEFDLQKRYFGKNNERPLWRNGDFPDGKINNLKLFAKGCETDAVVYLHRELTVDKAAKVPVSLGSDDTLTVWLNGKKLLAHNGYQPCRLGEHRITLDLNAGKNTLLLKVCQGGGDWQFAFAADLPSNLAGELTALLDKDFPESKVAKVGKKDAPKKAGTPEDRYYRMVSLPIPDDAVLEVGGVEMTPDGRLMVCTRRGEIWAVHNPLSEDPSKVVFKRFVRGLHEALGLRVINDREFLVVQRPELTRIKDTDGDGEADDFETLCDKWGVSGDYHEYSFLGPKEKDGSYTITLNRGFGGGVDGGSTNKSLYRGWALRYTAKGEVVPYAVGLRSPNGIGTNLDGDVFYADNQGEWVAACKLHHLRPGDFYGHPFGLPWVKGSPLEGKWPADTPNGLLYDGGVGKSGKSGMPPLNPPAIWFPYGKMSNSTSEPLCDTNAGKFGPFAGQLIVGDQTKSNLMRVALEKVKGQYQGAVFHFRAGFDCGVNRLCWASDGSLFVGMTSRGWGSLGSKPYALQRLIWTGEVPVEIHTMAITSTGWDLTFTKPLDPATAGKLEAYSLQSYTYNYFSTYGSPEVDRKAETVKSVKVSADGKKVSIETSERKPGRVYELLFEGVKSTDGVDVLHPAAWYTVNNLP